MVGIEGFKEQEGQSKVQSQSQTEYKPGQATKSFSDIAARDAADAEADLEAALKNEGNNKDLIDEEGDGNTLPDPHFKETPSSVRNTRGEQTREISQRAYDIAEKRYNSIERPKIERPKIERPELIKRHADIIVRVNKTAIENAAKDFGVDKSLVAAIIYEEQRYYDDEDKKYDKYGHYGFDTSIGLGQVKVSTGEKIENRTHEPGRNGAKIEKQTRLTRATELEKPEVNTKYVAAYIKKIQDVRKSKFPAITQRPDIVYTIYNKGLDKCTPRATPESNDRGKEVKALYPHAERLLG